MQPIQSQQQYHHQQQQPFTTHQQQPQQRPVVVTSNGTSAHISTTNTRTMQPGYINNNNYPLNNLVNAALNPNASLTQSHVSQQQQVTQQNRSRKRKRTDGMVVDDTIDEDPEAEWVPPSKRPKYGNNDGSAIIDLANESDNEHVSINNNNNNNNKKGRGRGRKINNTNNSIKNQKEKPKLKFTLKRRKNPATHTTNIEAIKREIAAKKKNLDPSLNGGDMFPYSGPSLTRIRPMIASYPIVVPSYGRWFRLDRIHPIEYQSIPSLFENKSMQYHERYMQIRNFIVNSYRVNPRIYLTVTSCRRIIAADAGAVYRIHKFLEEWGLINYQVDDGSIPEFEPPILDYTHVDTPFGVKIALKPDLNRNNNNNNSYKIFNDNKQKLKKLKKATFHQRENLFSMADGEYNDKNKESQLLSQNENIYECSYCGIDCSQARYRCNIQKDMILCSKCFDSKRYSMIFDDNDFDMELQEIKHDTNDNNNDDNDQVEIQKEEEKKIFNIQQWNEDELKKLKQALNQFHDDWTKVSEYVGRDQQECIAQFLQLPINDTFLETVEDKRDPNINKIYHPQISQYLASSISSTNPIEHMLSFLNPNPKTTPSPFADAGHPVLGQVASLSAIVNSEIVNVASNAALKFVNNHNNISPNDLNKNCVVDTKMGRGIIEQVINRQVSNHNNNNNNITNKNIEYQVKFEWGSSILKYDDIIDIINEEEKTQSSNGNLSSWHKYPENVSQSKAKAAGVLGTSAAIAKALKNHKDTHIQQLLQHLVLLQSQKVKFSIYPQYIYIYIYNFI